MTMMHTEHKYFKIYQMESRTLSWWKTRKEKIDMEPPYQRKGRRWSKTDKQYLIDSILNGFDVPKFYVADFTWGKSLLNTLEKTYAVIDGKQRFEAIFDFFDNNLKLADDFELIANPGLNIGGASYDELRQEHPLVAEIFENFNPVVMGVVTEEVRFVEELFVRLNRSKPLTGAEIRNAMPGAASEIVRDIVKHDFFKSNLKFDGSKGQYLNLAAKLLVFEASNQIVDTKKGNLDEFIKNAGDLDHVIPALISTLDLMSGVFKFSDPLLSSEGPVPVYYWLVRNVDRYRVREVRDFLEHFLVGLKLINSERTPFMVYSDDLTSYVKAARSINDKGSHERRYQILQKWFQCWPNEQIWSADHKQKMSGPTAVLTN